MKVFIKSIEFTYIELGVNVDGSSTLVPESAFAEIRYVVILQSGVHLKAEIRLPVTDGMTMGDIKYQIAQIYKEE